MRLPKYSIGVGDRFAHQGPAQLDALILAAPRGGRDRPGLEQVAPRAHDRGQPPGGRAGRGRRAPCRPAAGRRPISSMPTTSA